MKKPLNFLCLCFLNHFIDVRIFYEYIIMVNRWVFFDKLEVLFNFVVIINNTRLVKIQGTDFALLAGCKGDSSHKYVTKHSLSTHNGVPCLLKSWVGLSAIPCGGRISLVTVGFGRAQIICDFLTLLLSSSIILDHIRKVCILKYTPLGTLMVLPHHGIHWPPGALNLPC